MNRIYIFCFFLSGSAFKNPVSATINYTFTALSGTYIPNSGGTAIAEMYAGADAVTSATYPIGFTFNYDGTVFTQFSVSDNGCLFFGNSVPAADPASGDAIMPNSLSAANTTRPFAAPLWDDLGVWSSVNYLVSGNAPNRMLTVEWSHMDWKFNVASYGGNHDNISFQVKLYETSDMIEFVYNPEAGALANCPSIGCGSASIGLAGSSTGDYYSLNNFSTSPLASKTVNNTNIYAKPAAGQIYRWTPVGSTGVFSISAVDLSLGIYPNPSSDKVYLTFSVNKAGSPMQIEMYDVAGKKIFCKDLPSAVGQNKTEADVRFLQKGIYFIRLGNSRPVKFVKQ